MNPGMNPGMNPDDDEHVTDMTGVLLRPGMFITYPSGRGSMKIALVRSVSGGILNVFTGRHGVKTKLSYPSQCIALDDDRVPNGPAKELLLRLRETPTPERIEGIHGPMTP